MKCIILLLISLRAFQARQVWPGDPAFQTHYLERRRFGQESIPAALFNGLEGCPGQICGNLGGGSIKPLLAMQPPCSQQDYADLIIDAALNKSNGITSEKTRQALIDIAIKFRKAEKNSKPIYWPQVVGRNSLYCQKPPRHSQLNGLVQAQDPANNKTLFFDPSKITINDGTVLLGSQPDTFPFGHKPSDKDLPKLNSDSVTNTSNAVNNFGSSSGINDGNSTVQSTTGDTTGQTGTVSTTGQKGTDTNTGSKINGTKTGGNDAGNTGETQLLSANEVNATNGNQLDSIDTTNTTMTTNTGTGSKLESTGGDTGTANLPNSGFAINSTSELNSNKGSDSTTIKDINNVHLTGTTDTGLESIETDFGIHGNSSLHSDGNDSNEHIDFDNFDVDSVSDNDDDDGVNDENSIGSGSRSTTLDSVGTGSGANVTGSDAKTTGGATAQGGGSNGVENGENQLQSTNGGGGTSNENGINNGGEQGLEHHSIGGGSTITSESEQQTTDGGSDNNGESQLQSTDGGDSTTNIGTTQNSNQVQSLNGTTQNGNQMQSLNGTTQNGNQMQSLNGTTQNGNQMQSINGTTQNGNQMQSLNGTTQNGNQVRSLNDISNEVHTDSVQNGDTEHGCPSELGTQTAGSAVSFS